MDGSPPAPESPARRRRRSPRVTGIACAPASRTAGPPARDRGNTDTRATSAPESLARLAEHRDMEADPTPLFAKAPTRRRLHVPVPAPEENTRLGAPRRRAAYLALEGLQREPPRWRPTSPPASASRRS